MRQPRLAVEPSQQRRRTPPGSAGRGARSARRARAGAAPGRARAPASRAGARRRSAGRAALARERRARPVAAMASRATARSSRLSKKRPGRVRVAAHQHQLLDRVAETRAARPAAPRRPAAPPPPAREPSRVRARRGGSRRATGSSTRESRRISVVLPEAFGPITPEDLARPPPSKRQIADREGRARPRAPARVGEAHAPGARRAGPSRRGLAARARAQEVDEERAPRRTTVMTPTDSSAGATTLRASVSASEQEDAAAEQRRRDEHAVVGAEQHPERPAARSGRRSRWARRRPPPPTVSSAAPAKMRRFSRSASTPSCRAPSSPRASRLSGARLAEDEPEPDRGQRARTRRALPGGMGAEVAEQPVDDAAQPVEVHDRDQHRDRGGEEDADDHPGQQQRVHRQPARAATRSGRRPRPRRSAPAKAKAVSPSASTSPLPEPEHLGHAPRRTRRRSRRRAPRARRADCA